MGLSQKHEVIVNSKHNPIVEINFNIGGKQRTG